MSLVREHTLQMNLPRFLWVPFELGRPFGAPHQPDFQRRVLRTCLNLLERTDGPVILDDFPEDAPRDAEDEQSETPWVCPVSFPPPADDQPELVQATLEEMKRLEPWHEIASQNRKSDRSSVGPLEHRDFIRALGAIAQGDLEPPVATDAALREWVRLGCDDIHNWYLDAARGQPGRASSRELADWFWLQTAAARLIGAAAGILAEHPDPMTQALARRALVPREYLGQLAPGIEPFL